MKIEQTTRGFDYASFTDRYDNKCSIQKSSLAFEDAIWFGIEDADPQIMAADAKRIGMEVKESSGWVKYPLPKEVHLTTRMHLTREQVKELLPTLILFAETGELK